MSYSYAFCAEDGARVLSYWVDLVVVDAWEAEFAPMLDQGVDGYQVWGFEGSGPR